MPLHYDQVPLRITTFGLGVFVVSQGGLEPLQCGKRAQLQKGPFVPWSLSIWVLQRGHLGMRESVMMRRVDRAVSVEDGPKVASRKSPGRSASLRQPLHPGGWGAKDVSRELACGISLGAPR